MIRLLVAVLLVAGCGSGSDQPATGPAGKVVALTGTVRAERGEPVEIRELAVGDVVNAEDEIVTDDDASVRITLDHNNATWSLEGGERRRVRESAAWKAPKQQGGAMLAGDDDDRTTSAGRHAEREAADTRTTAAETTTAEPDIDDVVAQDPPPDDGIEGGPGGLGLQGTGRGGGGTGEGTIGLGNVGTIGKGGGGGTGSGYGRGSGGAASDGPKPRVRIEVDAIEGDGLGIEIVRRVLRQHLPRVRACYEKVLRSDPGPAGSVTVVITISAQGTVSAADLIASKTSDGLPEELTACVARGLRQASFPKPVGGEEVLATVVVRLSSEAP